MHEIIFVERPKFLAATSNLGVEQSLVHLGRVLHFSQKGVGVTLITLCLNLLLSFLAFRPFHNFPKLAIHNIYIVISTKYLIKVVNILLFQLNIFQTLNCQTLNNLCLCLSCSIFV